MTQIGHNAKRRADNMATISKALGGSTPKTASNTASTKKATPKKKAPASASSKTDKSTAKNSSASLKQLKDLDTSGENWKGPKDLSKLPAGLAKGWLKKNDVNPDEYFAPKTEE